MTRTALGLLALLLAGTAWGAEPAGVALDPAKAVTQLAHRAWLTENGLPQNSVRAMVQTRDGHLWLGTQEGLVRFDGVRFTVFDKANTPGIRHNFVWTLLEDREGALWIGTVGGGVTRMHDGTFTAFTTREGLANDSVRALHQDRAGTVWIGTDGGLDHFRDGRLARFTSAGGPSTDHVRALHEDGDGALWIGTDGAGLRRVKDGQVTTFTTASGLADGRILALCGDRDGSLWIGTQNGLNRLAAGRFTVHRTKDGLPHDIVAALHQDRQGSLWIGTYGGGLGRLASGRVSSFGAKDGLSHDMVASLLQDREGTLWVGTDGGGLNRLQETKFATLTTREGLPHDLALAVHADRAGRLWVGTNGGGVSRVEDGVVRTWTTRDCLSSNVVFSVADTRDGSVWIGTDAGLDRLHQGRLSRLTTADGLSSARVRVLYEDRQGVLWIGTDGGGLNRLQDGRITHLTTRDGLASDIVIGVFEDRGGALWIGTEGGLHRLEGGALTRLTTADGLPSNFIFSLHQDQDGVLWVGTYGGLARIEGGRITSFTTKHGLFDDLVAQILEDRQGHFWMSSNRGVSRVSRAELNAVAAGTRNRVSATAYGTADGMRSSECNGGFQPAGAQTPDGRLWFPTVKGVAVVDPQHITFNGVPPSVVVGSVTVDDHAVDLRKDVHLPAGTRRLEIEYTALAFRAPEKVRFKYRLEGQDVDWVDAGTRRTAYYTNVPAGRHRFLVMAANEDGVWSPAAQGFAFAVAPHFYETWWFYLAAGMVLATGLRTAHRARVRTLVEQEQRLTTLVEERTRDLREAQEKISRLLQSAPGASQSIPAWSRALAEDIAAAVGVERIGLWEIDGDALAPLSESGIPPPSAAELRTLRSDPGAGQVQWGERTVVPVTGPGGELCGALVVAGRAQGWGDTERRLVLGLAHQIGGALEMSHMRRQLASAEERRAATRREMHDRGIATLQTCGECGRCYDHTVTACAEDGTPLDSFHLLPYVLLDRYRFDRFLGEGGTGMVLAAHDQKLGREVAIKLIRPERFGQPERKERFEREARAVAQIRHEGVIGLYDSGELEDGTAFLVMEKLQGCDLALLLKTHGAGRPAQVASLVRQGSAALAAAHRAGLVHRDIKPENIFLVDGAAGFGVKLLDFGLAKSMTLEKGLTQTGTVMGTPKYMSPEQVRGEDVDARSDLYSFATVCYEALRGSKAIAGDDLGRVLMNVLFTSPAPLSAAVGGLPPEVDTLFAQALAKDAAHRPASIEAWGASLAALLDETPAADAVAGWPESPGAIASTPRSTEPTAPRLSGAGLASLTPGSLAGGTVLEGKYRLDEPIGSGEFGAVFRGQHLHLDRTVAIKVFRPLPGNDTPEALSRFRHEGMTLSRLQHPNIVSVYDCGVAEGGLAYIVMELLVGRTLEAEMAGQPRAALERCAQVLHPVLEALEAMHKVALVYRDVKPGNIFLHRAPREVVKVLDFGIAKALHEGSAGSPLSRGIVVGVPAYAAPERLQGLPYDGRADVYGVGVLLYQMLSGRLPFAARPEESVGAATLRAFSEAPPPLDSDDVPPEVERMIVQALSPDPARRPTARELGEALAVWR